MGTVNRTEWNRMNAGHNSEGVLMTEVPPEFPENVSTNSTVHGTVLYGATCLATFVRH